MADTGVIPRQQVATDWSTSLPENWEERATTRLAWLALAVVSAAAVAILMLPFRQPNVGGIRSGLERPVIVIPLALVISIAVYLLARNRSLAAQRRLDFGLAWLVILAAFAAIFRHWLPYESTDVVRGPSVISLGVLFFAAMVPVRPRKMLITAVLAALMDLLGLVFSILALDNPAPRFNMWLWLFVPGTVACAISVMASRTLHMLGKTVRQALEMGSYRLIERLGAGGMGEVWLARHHTLARPAAIKLIKQIDAGEQDAERAREVMQRFELEAQATARLQSPHTIELYDFGIATDGRFYYVMELLDGMDLKTLVERFGPLPEERVAYLLKQACHSLRDAHEAGMIHRDVKPANIYLCRKGLDLDVVKVLDFGLVAYESGGTEKEHSIGGELLGTPAYMPPEMARGEAHTDGRADIYSLGCVAFWLLTGRPVFKGEHLLQIIQAHCHEDPPRPSEVLGRALDARLERLVLRCLEKQPDDRPESCYALMRALEGMVFEPPWTNEQARAWWAEHVPEAADACESAQGSREGASFSTVVLKSLASTQTLRD